MVAALLADPAGLPGRTREVTADPRRRTLTPPRRSPGCAPPCPPPVRRPGGWTTRTTSGRACGRSCSTPSTARAARAASCCPSRWTGSSAGWPTAGERHVVVFSHNPLDASDGGEAALAALGGAGNVVAAIAGHRHTNSIEPDRAGGFWRISTSSLADFPQQARMFRLSEGADGGVVLDTWMVDQDGRGPAGTARELAYLDAQGGRPQGYAGRAADRNARLFLP